MAKFGIALGSGPRGHGFESRHFDQKKTVILIQNCSHFFIHYGVMAYHHRTKCGGYHQKERGNRSFLHIITLQRVLKLRNDDIQNFVLMIYRNKLRMIYTFCESDLVSKPFLATKRKSFNLYSFSSIYGVSFNL